MTRRLFVSVLALGLFAATTPPVLAHEGHDHKTMGVVTMIHENHLEVKDLKGKSTTFTLAAATRILRNKAVVKRADIKVGDRVVVTTRETKDKAGKVTVAVREVQLGAAAAAAAKK